MNEQEAQQAVAKFWNAQPSPHAPGLTNGEYPQAVKLATRIKYGGHAKPDEASNFWKEFKGLNSRLAAAKKPPLSPEQFGHIADDLARVSFRFHGRPPTMHEIERLHDMQPEQINKYFFHLPDRDHAEVPAGEMVKHLTAAKGHANEFIKRDPVKSEIAELWSSGESPRDYYQRLASQNKQQEEAPVTSSGPPPQQGESENNAIQAPSERDGS